MIGPLSHSQEKEIDRYIAAEKLKECTVELEKIREENSRLRMEKGDLEKQLNDVLKENQKLKAEREAKLHKYEE